MISPYKSEKTKFNEISIPEISEVGGIFFLSLPMYVFRNISYIFYNPLIVTAQNFDMYNISWIDRAKMYMDVYKLLHEKIFSNHQVKKLLSSKSDKYDVVIYEHIANEMFSG